MVCKNLRYLNYIVFLKYIKLKTEYFTQNLLQIKKINGMN